MAICGEREPTSLPWLHIRRAILYVIAFWRQLNVGRFAGTAQAQAAFQSCVGTSRSSAGLGISRSAKRPKQKHKNVGV